jgi:stage IV sporulation protein FB
MLQLCKGCIRISFGFFLLSGWFAWGCGGEALAAVLLASMVHELGHFLVLRLFGARIRGLRLEMLGMVMETDTSQLSYPKELAAALAGPAANLLFAAFLAGRERWLILVGANLSLCLFNLLPIPPLDGGRAAELCLVWFLGPDRGEALAGILGRCCGLLLGAGLLFLMAAAKGNLWLLPPALSALGMAIKRRKKVSFFRKKCLHS